MIILKCCRWLKIKQASTSHKSATRSKALAEDQGQEQRCGLQTENLHSEPWQEVEILQVVHEYDIGIGREETIIVEEVEEIQGSNNSSPRSEEEDSVQELSEKEESDSHLQPKKRKIYKPKINVGQIKENFPWVDETRSYPFCKVCRTNISGGIYHLKRHQNMQRHNTLMTVAEKNVKINSFPNKFTSKALAVKRAELKMAAYIYAKKICHFQLWTLYAI